MSLPVLPELAAMQQIADIVSNLTVPQKRRVAAWFSEYASQESTAQQSADTVDGSQYDAMDANNAATQEPYGAYEAYDEVYEDLPKTYDSFAEILEAVAPKTGAQKAVTAGYWLETRQSHESWKASEVNKLLKQANVKVSSISIVLTNAVKAADPLVEQLARLGDGERSRKTFRLTEAGIAFVEQRL